MAPFLGDAFARQVSGMDIEVWVEPFAGGAGAGLTMLDRGLVQEVWLTEKHPAIAALWRTILGDGPNLAARVLTTTPDMKLWEQSQARVATLNEGGAVDDDELAFAALVLNRCSRSGIIAPKVGPIGGRSQSGRWKLTSRWNGEALSERVSHIANLSDHIRFNEGDAITAIEDLRESGIEDEVMLFVDPPYIREGNRLYANGMTENDHQRLADVLNASPARWLLTYDDEPEVATTLYPDRRIVRYKIPNTANRVRIATEFAVMSDNLEISPSLEFLPGAFGQWLNAESRVAA